MAAGRRAGEQGSHGAQGTAHGGAVVGRRAPSTLQHCGTATAGVAARSGGQTPNCCRRTDAVGGVSDGAPPRVWMLPLPLVSLAYVLLHMLAQLISLHLQLPGFIFCPLRRPSALKNFFFKWFHDCKVGVV